MPFIYGGNTPWTYDQIQRQRDIAAQLAGNIGTPRNVGEGLSAIGRALASRGLNKRADASDATNKAEFDKMYGDIPMGGAQPSDASPAPPVQYDPNSPSAIGNATMSALDKPSNDFKPGDRESFTNAMMPHAIEAGKMTGIDPRLIIAQAAQETGWGAHVPGNNYFGVKSHGQGGGATLATTEYVNGQPQTENASFRTYSGMRDSALGYAKFLKENPRYQPMMNARGLDAQVAALGRSGYATDPNYASSVGAIANSIGKLAAIAGSPYASPAQKAIVGALIQRQLEASQPPDPMKALELQKAEYEVAHLGDKKQPSLQTFNGPDGTVYSFDPTSGTTSPLTGAKDPNADGGTEYGLTPQYGVDAQGNPVLIQVGKNGTTTSPKLPDGVSLSKSPIKIDAGTEWILLDPITRQPVGRIPKELAAAATETAVGKATGEAMAAKNSLSSKMAGIEAVVKRLDDLSNKATYTTAGRVLDYGIAEAGMQPRESAVARSEYIATVNNQILPLLRDTFGAQFTEREGATLRETLGDPNKTPAEKQVVLKAFVEQKRRDLQSLDQQSSGKEPASAVPPVNNGGYTIEKVQ